MEYELVDEAEVDSDYASNEEEMDGIFAKDCEILTFKAINEN